MTILDGALLLLGLSVGLTFAAHGAQKAFGWWGGPGMTGWKGSMAAMGFRPPALFAFVSTLAELGGGLCLALGLLTSVAAGLLVAESVVLIFHVHWQRGFWNVDKGIEFPLQLAVGAVVLGLVGRGLLGVDGLLAMAGVVGPDALGSHVVDVNPPLAARLALLLAGALTGSVALVVPQLAAGRSALRQGRS